MTSHLAILTIVAGLSQVLLAMVIVTGELGALRAILVSGCSRRCGACSSRERVLPSLRLRFGCDLSRRSKLAGRLFLLLLTILCNVGASLLAKIDL